MRLPTSFRLTRAVAVPLLLAVVATASSPGWIRVRRGDTLWELARRHGTTVAALRELNGIGGNNLIIEGQMLRIGRVPAVERTVATTKVAQSRPVATSRPSAKRVLVVHTVVRGDSLFAIAARYRADPKWIAERNKLPTSRIVVIGQKLVVGSRWVRTASAAPVRADRPQRVSKSYARQLVVNEARRAGVDPNLAVALALQESGLQQHVVSSVGAVGIMQVMPGTGRWVGKHLVGRSLNLNRAEDNVVAGVRFLAFLLKIAKSKNEALAGYYQGLASVRSRGMYDDTKAYITNVLALQRRLASRSR